MGSVRARGFLVSETEAPDLKRSAAADDKLSIARPSAPQAGPDQGELRGEPRLKRRARRKLIQDAPRMARLQALHEDGGGIG